MVTPTPGLHPDIPETDYHADRGSLSVSGAKTILECPARYRWQLDHPVHRDVFDIGSAAHTLVLGVGPEIVVVDAPTWQTKAAKAERDAARERGATPVLAHDYERVQSMADTLTGHRLAMALLTGGQAEVSAYAPDPDTSVTRRGRFDYLGPRMVVDYKTAATADPDAFGRTAATYGYDMQAAWYLDLAADTGHPAEGFAFIVQEKTAPYLVSVVELDGPALARGRRRNRRALDTYADCKETDTWPGYLPDTEYATVSVPRWALYEEGLA